MDRFVMIGTRFINLDKVEYFEGDYSQTRIFMDSGAVIVIAGKLEDALDRIESQLKMSSSDG